MGQSNHKTNQKSISLILQKFRQIKKPLLLFDSSGKLIFSTQNTLQILGIKSQKELQKSSYVIISNQNFIFSFSEIDTIGIIQNLLSSLNNFHQFIQIIFLLKKSPKSVFAKIKEVEISETKFFQMKIFSNFQIQEEKTKKKELNSNLNSKQEEIEEKLQKIYNFSFLENNEEKKNQINQEISSIHRIFNDQKVQIENLFKENEKMKIEKKKEELRKNKMELINNQLLELDELKGKFEEEMGKVEKFIGIK
ncbi:hypothetical protein M0811_03803 [Anaeramoeba ignava]|uniref:Uncharacterized protein n=1 Tax=Anaeramoeba ignava TaxID=1746090 RepID=A0A9Q0LZL2_ANAIG|nr:hypothetical protein M0811_03803 [Anaeramoeba ignava]